MQTVRNVIESATHSDVLGGKGSIGQDRHKKLISTMTHKQMLLMYHDKRFQTDADFPLIALNHEQIQSGTAGGCLLVKKKEFQQITDHIVNLDLNVLADLTKRMSDGEHVKPESDKEKDCFKLIHDLDHVGKQVYGSMTNKKIYAQ